MNNLTKPVLKYEVAIIVYEGSRMLHIECASEDIKNMIIRESKDFRFFMDELYSVSIMRIQISNLCDLKEVVLYLASLVDSSNVIGLEDIEAET